MGASAGLGRSIAEDRAKRGDALLLLASHERDLEAVSIDLSLRYKVKVTWAVLDLVNLSSDNIIAVRKMIDQNIDNLFLVAGKYYDHDDGSLSCLKINNLISVNYSGPLILISDLLSCMNHKSKLVIISSIACIRARPKSIVYASSKTGLEFFAKAIQASGINQVSVYIFRIGYMGTSMTIGKKLLLPLATTAQVAEKISLKLMGRHGMYYLPSWWRCVDIILKSLPAPIFLWVCSAS